MAFRSRSRIRSEEDETDSAPSLSPERQESRARNVLLHQLTRSAKSKAQLRKILAEREIDSEIAERILERFEETGLINDREFAKTVTQSRHRIKGLAKSSIRRELVEKGVEQALIEEALADVDSHAELTRATELAVQRAQRMTHLELDVARRRLSGYLARKGYSGAVVASATRLALSDR